MLPLYPGLSLATQTSKATTTTTTTTTTKSTTTTPKYQPVNQEQLMGNMPSPKLYPDANTGMIPSTGNTMDPYSGYFGNQAYNGYQFGMGTGMGYGNSMMGYGNMGMGRMGMGSQMGSRGLGMGSLVPKPQPGNNNPSGVKPASKPALVKQPVKKPSYHVAKASHNNKFTSKIQQIRHLAALRNRPPPTTTTPAPTTSTYSPHDCGRDKNGILWCAGNRIYEKPKPKPKKKPIDNGGRVVLSKYTANIGKGKTKA